MRTAERGPRSFDPVVVGNREAEAWSSYYRHEWRRFLTASVGMVGAAFGMDPRRTLEGAWYVLRANQLWAPYPDNQADGAQDYMRRFYELVVVYDGLTLDPAKAARLEVEWWRIHREYQHDDEVTIEHLEAALVDLYSYAYSTERDTVRPAALKRVEAMHLSDRWVRAGCHRDDPLLAAERRALVASYTALRDAMERMG